MRPNSQASGTDRSIIAAIFLALFAYAFVMTLPQASENELARAFNVLNGPFSTVFRLFMFGFLAAAVSAGWFSDRFGKINVIAAGCGLMALGMFLFYRSQSFIFLPYASAIAGFGGGLAEIGGTSALSDIYSGPKRTSMMNFSQVIFSAGAVTQPLIFAKILRMGYGWKPGYIIAVGLCLVAFGIAGYASATGYRSRPTPATSHTSWLRIAKDRTVMILSISLLLYIGAELGVGSWLANYMEHSLGATPSVAAGSVALLWIGIGAGRWIATFLSRHLSDTLLIKWSMAISIMSAIGLLTARNPISGIALTFLLGLPLGPIWPTIMSRAGYVFQSQSSAVIGIVASAGCIGGALLPSLIGITSDSIGIRYALWIAVGALIIGLIVMTMDRGEITDLEATD